VSPRSTAPAPRDHGFAALADPTRRRILALLAKRDRTVLEIARHFPVSRPAISKHLRLLRESGLVTETKMGRERVQRFNGSALQPVSEWVRYYEAFWRERLVTLKTLVEDEE
jgi:DNA-binding transcriptional ArsR family regulator